MVRLVRCNYWDSKKTVYINLDRVTHFEPLDSGNRTLLEFDRGHTIKVADDPKTFWEEGQKHRGGG